MRRTQPIQTAWDEAGQERWTVADQRRFDQHFREWARRTGNQTGYELRLDRGEAPFGLGRSRRRRA